MNLTIQILTKNNEQTLERTLKSIESLNTNIIIIDDGSTDSTLKIAKKHEIHQKGSLSRSEARNFFTKDGWNFYIEPWEKLGGQFTFEEPNLYRFLITKGDWIVKEVRLWHKGLGKFNYPIFENIQPEEKAINQNVLIYSETREIELNLIEEWKKKESYLCQPYYYESFYYLQKEEYDKFIKSAERFLFLSKEVSSSVIIIKYYLSFVYCFIKKSPREAITNLLICLSLKPLMAEFWCLLGDVYYFLLKEFDKAYRFYNNAIILGSQRKYLIDSYPIQLSKYKDYPQKRMDEIRNLKVQTLF